MGRISMVSPTGFADHFRALVTSTGLPLDRLADRVGRSATTLSRYQTGRGLPDEAVLAAVHRQAEHPPMPLAELVALLARARDPEPRRPSRRLALVAAAVVAAAAMGVTLLVVLDEPAESSVRRRVCAQDLLVRSEPARPSAGARRLGLLERGDAFDLARTSADGVYAYGYAHGSVNINGWVDAQWLCPPD